MNNALCQAIKKTLGNAFCLPVPVIRVVVLDVEFIADGISGAFKHQPKDWFCHLIGARHSHAEFFDTKFLANKLSGSAFGWLGQQNRQQQLLVFRPDTNKATTFVRVGAFDALAEIRLVSLHQTGHGAVVAGVIDQDIVGKRCIANGLARFTIDTELASSPGNLRFRSTDFILDGVLEADFTLVVKLIQVAKYLDQRLKQIRLSTTVFADKHIDETRTIKTQGEIFKVFVLADEY